MQTVPEPFSISSYELKFKKKKKIPLKDQSSHQKAQRFPCQNQSSTQEHTEQVRVVFLVCFKQQGLRGTFCVVVVSTLQQPEKLNSVLWQQEFPQWVLFATLRYLRLSTLTCRLNLTQFLDRK